MDPRIRTLLDRLTSTPVLLAAAGAVLAVLCVHQLTISTVRVAGTSGTGPRAFVANIPKHGGTLCQSQSTLPRDAGNVVMTVGTYGPRGPRLTVTYRKHRRVVGRGTLAKGWKQGVVAIALRPRGRDLEALKVCVHSPGGARLAFAGEPAGDPATLAGKPQDGRISIVGYTRTRQSTAHLLPELGRRIGRGSATLIGAWTVWAILVLTLAALALGGIAIAVTARRGDPVAADDEGVPYRPEGWRGVVARIPSAGWAVTAAALCLGVSWSLLTPPFQVADETSHVAYVQYLAESGKLPKEQAGVAPFSDRENAALGAIGFSRIVGRPGEKVPTSRSEETYLRTVEHQDLPARGAGNATTASGNPPLFYALQAPVYLATSGASLLTQLVFMRLLAVLFTTGAVLLAFLFARELVPRSPWAWTAAGLACAFQPVLGFVGSGVNPDSLLFLCATGTLFAGARLVRRGLTTRRAVLLGLFVLGGLLTKPLFFGMVPAAGLAMLIAGWNARRHGPWRPMLTGAAVVGVPLALYVLLAAGPLDHPYFAVASNVASNATGSGSSEAYTSLSKEVSYILQQFLPRLPFLTDLAPGAPIEDVWINGLTGVFGWVDYQLPIEDTHFAVRVLELLLVLAAAGLISTRRRIVAHLPLAAVCLVAMAGLLGAVGVTDYQAYLTDGARFQQARYVLPLLALYGGLFALAARGLGERAGRVAVNALWVLVGVHTVAAMVLTANRYYL